MIEAVDEGTKKKVFVDLIDVANAIDAKRIKMHQSFEEGAAAQAMSPVGQQRHRQAELPKELE